MKKKLKKPKVWEMQDEQVTTRTTHKQTRVRVNKHGAQRNPQINHQLI